MLSMLNNAFDAIERDANQAVFLNALDAGCAADGVERLVIEKA